MALNVDKYLQNTSIFLGSDVVSFHGDGVVSFGRLLLGGRCKNEATRNLSLTLTSTVLKSNNTDLVC